MNEMTDPGMAPAPDLDPRVAAARAADRRVSRYQIAAAAADLLEHIAAAYDAADEDVTGHGLVGAIETYLEVVCEQHDLPTGRHTFIPALVRAAAFRHLAIASGINSLRACRVTRNQLEAWTGAHHTGYYVGWLMTAAHALNPTPNTP